MNRPCLPTRVRRGLLVAAICIGVIGACGGGSSAQSPPPAGSESSAARDVAPAGFALPACQPGSGRTYDVGPGQAIQKVGGVPWPRLRPGDTVRIHHRPEPYREKILLSASGTADAPIRVCGVPDASGRLPVIDGSDATTDPAMLSSSPYSQARSVVLISENADTRWGYKPSHVIVEGLEIRNAYTNETFVDSSGKRQPYADNAAALYVERGEHITVRGCVLHGSGNGLFVASSDDEAMQSRDILVEGNHVYGNGSTGDRKDRHHNIYTEAIGMVFQYNRIGPLREGSGGNALKDRSAGTVIRYNWIEGGARSLDLVEPEDSHNQAVKVPRFGDAYVYGNVIVTGRGSASRTFHYGGDSGEEQDYRKGTLFFYNNTVLIVADESDHYFTSLFQLETDAESADVRNNIFLRVGDTHLTWAFEKGTLRLGVNWVSAGIEAGRKEFTGRIEHVSGTKQTIEGKDPGFRGLSDQDFCLAPGSPARGVGAALPTGLPAEHQPTSQYWPHQSGRPRPRQGAGDDLGALVCP